MVRQAVKSAGESFGELALKFDQDHPQKEFTRQATITTKCDCVFAIIGKQDYRNCFERIDKKNAENRIKFF